MSKLIPQKLLSEIPDLYATEDITDPICQVKLFTPDSDWTWYIIELSKNNINSCFGYVKGLENELGFFTLEELELVHGPLGLPIEMDIWFKPTRLSQLKDDRFK